MKDGNPDNSESLGLGDAITHAKQKKRQLYRKYARARYEDLSVKKKCEIAISRGEASVFINLGCIDANRISGGLTENEYTVLCEMIEDEGLRASVKHCDLEVHRTEVRCDSTHSVVGEVFAEEIRNQKINSSRIHYCGIQIDL